MSNINSLQIQKFLTGIDYPTTKEELVEYALDQGADEDILATLRQLSEDIFYSPTEINSSLNAMKESPD